MTFAPRLTKEKIEIAITLLDGWTGKLTWSRYLAMFEVEVGHKYTKAALLRHAKFKDHWDKRRWSKDTQDTNYNFYGNQGLNLALEKINKLEQTIERLKRDNNLLNERLVIWATNASQKGLSLEDLNKSIPTNNSKTYY